jgi:hypothetical protein
MLLKLRRNFVTVTKYDGFILHFSCVMSVIMVTSLESLFNFKMPYH